MENTECVCISPFTEARWRHCNLSLFRFSPFEKIELVYDEMITCISYFVSLLTETDIKLTWSE